MRREGDEYEAAMERCLAIEPRNLEWADGRKPTRDELHDRSKVYGANTVCCSERQMGPRDQRSRKTP